MKRALIFFGGWDGHHPKRLSEIFTELLQREGFEVESHNNLEVLTEKPLGDFDLIVPIWTMGEITGPQLRALVDAVNSGVGLAGCHGGMCDAFRAEPEYQFMTGGQWVAHPGDDGVPYEVKIVNPEHLLTKGLSDFQVVSEQYYMHVDPANKVLATTRFPTAPGPHSPNGEFDMPVIWTRTHGNGRVFYSSLGHDPSVIEAQPSLELMRRGLLWAANAY